MQSCWGVWANPLQGNWMLCATSDSANNKQASNTIVSLVVVAFTRRYGFDIE
jgi:hypothetical protein